MKKVLFLSAIALLLSMPSSYAYVYGSSNLPLNRYPEMSSYDKPSSYGTPSQYEMERYRRALNDYLENANNDIQRIQEAKNEAIREYNDAVRRYNNSY